MTSRELLFYSSYLIAFLQAPLDQLDPVGAHEFAGGRAMLPRLAPMITVGI